jgi:FMN phosphatase YigB (HAD superfamily)
LALDLIRHRAEECLLIDDRSVNIECARNLGMQVIQFHDATQLRKDLGAQGFDV